MGSQQLASRILLIANVHRRVQKISSLQLIICQLKSIRAMSIKDSFKGNI
jgi:hypothetical protein